MTSHHRLLLFAAAAGMAAACVPTQRAVRGPAARGSEAWSWRMSATEGRWSQGRSQVAVRNALEAGPAPAQGAAEPKPAAAGDEVEMTLEPDPVGPAKKPKAVAVAVTPAAPPARDERRARPAPIRGSDSDEEFLNKILDDNADAEGEITMAAMELPKSKADRARAKKKLVAPVTDPAVDLEADLAPIKPAKKKRMTRAEKRKARLLAKLEKKRAKEIAAREARLRGKRARVDEEEQARASHARKSRRKTRKGKFFKNGEGFLDEEIDSAGDDDEDTVATSDEDEEDDEDEEADEDEDEEDDESEEEEAAPPAKKKAKPAVASSKTSAKPASRGKAPKVKTDWSGQVIDDEDPLKGKKKK